jgi:hypothetical protein
MKSVCVKTLCKLTGNPVETMHNGVGFGSNKNFGNNSVPKLNSVIPILGEAPFVFTAIEPVGILQ